MMMEVNARMRKTVTIISLLVIVAVIGVFAAGTVFAQANTPQATPATPGTQQAPGQRAPGGRGLGGLGLPFGGGSTAEYDAIAKALNLTPTQLFDQLHGGKTLSQIAQAQGVDLTTVQTAAKAAETQAAKDRINQAVKDGTMSQDQANWLLQGIDKGYIGGGKGFGFDFGFGRGRRGGPGRPAPQATPSAGTQS